MQKIDGRAIAAAIRQELKTEIENAGLHPKLAVLLAGEDPASHLYVSLKEKAAAEVGILTEGRKLPATSTTEKLISIIQSWNMDPEIDGVLVQIPLPPGIDENAVIAALDPAKDADGFHPANVQSLFEGKGVIIPPVHEGILRLIGATETRLNGARAVIIANSDEFAKPLAHLLRKAGALVQICKPDELDRETLARAEIVVIAVGRAGFIKRGMVSPGVCLIDVGTNRVNDKVVGDVDAESLKDLPGWLSPVPGGVGPMTIAMLLKNVLHISKLRRQRR
jgi:methylenetetrahydrofolate dehydrogenase (NADP+)/methenyltetrahydrofolate cyclohydrolase